MGAASGCTEGVTGLPRWARIAEVDALVVVTVVGGVAADRADELWTTLEEILELADGRLVVADLRQVTTFDLAAIDALATVARSATRRRDDFCLVMKPDSSLARYWRWRCQGIDRGPSTYPTVSVAVLSDGARRLVAWPEPGRRQIIAARCSTASSVSTSSRRLAYS